MSLAFANWRWIPSVLQPEVPSDSACRVRTPDALDASEQAQLVAALGWGSELSFTVAELFSPGFEEAGGDRSWIAMALETPIEWWDLCDEAGDTRFRVWFYMADCALVFASTTTNVEAQGIQFGSAWERWGADWEEGSPLSRELGRAHRAAAEAHPESLLAETFPIEER